MSSKKVEKVKAESLERLKNQLEQAKLNNDTELVKKIKAVIQRVEGGK